MNTEMHSAISLMEKRGEMRMWMEMDIDVLHKMMHRGLWTECRFAIRFVILHKRKIEKGLNSFPFFIVKPNVVKMNKS